MLLKKTKYHDLQTILDIRTHFGSCPNESKEYIEKYCLFKEGDLLKTTSQWKIYHNNPLIFLGYISNYPHINVKVKYQTKGGYWIYQHYDVKFLELDIPKMRVKKINALI